MASFFEIELFEDLFEHYIGKKEVFLSEMLDGGLKKGKHTFQLLFVVLWLILEKGDNSKENVFRISFCDHQADARYLTFNPMFAQMCLVFSKVLKFDVFDRNRKTSVLSVSNQGDY